MSSKSRTLKAPDMDRVSSLLSAESKRFVSSHPVSKKLHQQNLKQWMYGVPLHWMSHWPTPYPVYVRTAIGTSLLDVDGNKYIDFALGDTGAMFGHAQVSVVRAISDRLARGSTMMLPTEDSLWVGKELQRRFKLRFWQVATSASEANRTVIRLCRMITRRKKVLVFNGSYLGSVEETFAELDRSGKMAQKNRIYPNAMSLKDTTRLVEFNDLKGIENELSKGDTACVLTEPIMTNIGMVPPMKGFHEGLRLLTRRYDVPLIIDETHSISAGSSGFSVANGIKPDFFVLGKSIAGGIPVAIFGMSEAMFKRIRASLPEFSPGDPPSTFGFGSTLSGSALQMAAIRSTLSNVMTDSNYRRMISGARKLEAGINKAIRRHCLPWHVTRIGMRVEYLFMPRKPRNGGEAKKARNGRLEAFLHLYCLNRGILLSPFHNMAIVCPDTKLDDIETYTNVFSDSLDELVR
jgi:glutamate-1-semialdehyde 2,1-aminomutase